MDRDSGRGWVTTVQQEKGGIRKSSWDPLRTNILMVWYHHQHSLCGWSGRYAAVEEVFVQLEGDL